jgi:hypothetical protein
MTILIRYQRKKVMASRNCAGKCTEVCTTQSSHFCFP